MPMWLRNFTFKKIAEFNREQSEANKSKSNNDIDLANPNKSKIPSKRTASKK